jgi:hypothetical protein
VHEIDQDQCGMGSQQWERPTRAACDTDDHAAPTQPAEQD